MGAGKKPSAVPGVKINECNECRAFFSPYLKLPVYHPEDSRMESRLTILLRPGFYNADFYYGLSYSSNECEKKWTG